MGGLGWIRARRWTPYDAVRIALGLLLLTAAVLKGYQLATEPRVLRTEDSWSLPADFGAALESRWFLIAIVEFEWLLGLWLLAGLHRRQCCAVALACFIVFGGVSLSKAMIGEASCGCFGKVLVDPWHTFALDFAVVIALLRSWARNEFGDYGKHGDRFRGTLRPALLVSLWSLVAVLAAWTMVSPPSTTIAPGCRLLVDDRSVVLDPDEWVGQRFGLLDHIDIGKELSRGKWLVLLYRHDCPKCRAVVPRYEAFARQEGARDVALIEIPPYRTRSPAHEVSKAPDLRHGRVSSRYAWLAETPLEIDLLDGVVVASHRRS